MRYRIEVVSKNEKPSIIGNTPYKCYTLENPQVEWWFWYFTWDGYGTLNSLLHIKYGVNKKKFPNIVPFNKEYIYEFN